MSDDKKSFWGEAKDAAEETWDKAKDAAEDVLEKVEEVGETVATSTHWGTNLRERRATTA